MEGKVTGHAWSKFFIEVYQQFKTLLRFPFSRNYRGTIQTFTYYIPSPPKRKTGYREKEFDKIFYQFINQGFEILHFHTESHQSPTGSGMWVLFTVQSLRPENDQLNLEFPSVADDRTESTLNNLKKFRSDLKPSSQSRTSGGERNPGQETLNDSRDQEDLAIPLDIYYE